MRLVRTKIIATVGPASRDPEILTELIREGVDVFRVNAAHTPAEELAPWVRRIRRAAKTAGRTVATLVDLPGTKVRVGSLGSLGGIDLVEGQRVEIVRGSSGGNARRIPVSPMPWLDHLARGSRVLLADGQIELSVVGSTDDGVNAEVVQGGHLLAGKGADFPGARLPTRVPTARDVKLLEAAFAADADAIAKGVNAVVISHALQDPYSGFERFFLSSRISPAGSNWGMLKDSWYDEMLAKAAVTFDPDEQAKVLRTVHERVVDNAEWIWVTHDVNPRALSPRVKGFVQAKSWFQDLTPVSLATD